MEVADRQQLGLALGEPSPGGGALALRTMPVTAAVVGDRRVGAILAARHVAAESRGAAVHDGGHHLQLAKADMTRVGVTPRGAVVAEDIRDLEL